MVFCDLAPLNGSSKTYLMALLALTTIFWTSLGVMLMTLGLTVAPKTPRGCVTMTIAGPNDTVVCITGVLRTRIQTNQVGGMSSPDLARRNRFLRQEPKKNTQDKVILRWTKYYGKPWRIPEGRAIFEELQCPQRACVLTDDRSRVSESDAVLVHMRDVRTSADLPMYRRPEQRWIFYLLESPYHTQLNLSEFNGLFNWTSTYSYESDIPSPYGKYDIHNHKNATSALSKKIVFSTKRRIAAWFVTNCQAMNHRQHYVSFLQNHVMVDIYGICGRLKCYERDLCLDMLRRKYKFYLAFENSNCRQYITEKFWHNALESDIVPVVMGAPKEDYERVAPPHSFIHVDDFPSARDLARHLKMLDKEPRRYEDYFRWQRDGQVTTLINEHPTKSKFWCKLCSALHDRSLPNKIHWHLDTWWSVRSQCL